MRGILLVILFAFVAGCQRHESSDTHPTASANQGRTGSHQPLGTNTMITASPSRYHAVGFDVDGEDLKQSK